MANRFITSVADLAPAQVISLDALVSANDGDEKHAHFELADPSPTPDELVEQAQTFAAVIQFVRSLTAREQEIVWRIYWLDETQTMVGERLGVSKMAISKAMAKISAHGRKALAAHEHFALRN